MLKINKFYLNYSHIDRQGSRGRVSGSAPVFSWAALSDRSGANQGAYRIVVKLKDGKRRPLWDSGKVESRAQSAAYAGAPLPPGVDIVISLIIWDDAGEESDEYSDYFFNGELGEWPADWIAHPDDANGQKNTGRKTLIFKKDITIESKLESAFLYVCGLGYHHVRIKDTDILYAAHLDPAHSDYSKRVYYVATSEPELPWILKPGRHEIKITVADGWRNIDSELLDRHMGGRKTTFDGIKQLTAVLTLKYQNGKVENIYTGPDWQVCANNRIETNIFDGVTFDNRLKKGEYLNAAVVPSPGGKMQVMEIPPVRIKNIYEAKSVYSPSPGVHVADFGQNIAGTVHIFLPHHLKEGQKITIKYAEVKNEDGTINQAPLRGAKCADTYIAAGDYTDITRWQPCEFTYHGFRYAQVEGIPLLDKKDIKALPMQTEIDNDSFFECGDALVSKIHQNAVMTERANMHSILTDCPQRDERMGWLNDATVRFEETPYNFDIGRMFPKIIRDIIDAQSHDGAITCTAPYVFGSRPADPVCSSFLIAGNEALIHTGNLDIIREAYGNFKAWENCLLERSDNYIVNYSYYGDWAGPAYACDRPDGAVSALTPGILMSTGYSYLNAKLIAKFAGLLGYADDADEYADIAEKIKAAFLDKWFDPATCKVATGSQACQAFALWLGLIPKEYAQQAAKIMRDDLVDNNYRFTTGNLCTRYLFDMLAEYGYIDTAWELITHQEYPSFGYMIQNEATTIWERFELKLDPGMNSHCHPMYGAVDYWFYAYLAGVKPVSPAFEEFTVEPYYPEKLLSVNAVVDTIKGDVGVRWIKQYGKLWLYVTVPFGTEANVKTADGYVKAGSGSHRFLIGEVENAQVI